MRRREFIVLLGGTAATWPLVALAQQPDRMRRIGVLVPAVESDPAYQARIAAFRESLQKLGWSEGRNVRFDYRWAGVDPERMRASAAELVSLAPDVLLSVSNQATAILSQQTRTIPIVFVANDPVETGLITSMAHPGGNMTGFTPFEVSMGGKWLELLKEVVPRLARVAVLFTLGGQASLATLRVIEGLAPSLGVETTSVPARDPAEIERVIDAFSREANGGLIVLTGPGTNANRELIIALAARHRLPAIYPDRESVANGGLISYGADLVDQFRQAGSYVDRILKGEKPGDLPVQAATKFELIVNLKTAKALGLNIPESFLLRADELIE
jgi:putative tryptophan/tyrosine transport system substrate-binding protein